MADISAYLGLYDHSTTPATPIKQYLKDVFGDGTVYVPYTASSSGVTSTSNAFNAPYNAASNTIAQVVKAATTSKSIYITDLLISTDTQQTVKFQDNTGTPVVEVPILYLPANGTIKISFVTPIQVASGKELDVVCGGNVGSVSVLVGGWVA